MRLLSRHRWATEQRDILTGGISNRTVSVVLVGTMETVRDFSAF